MGDLSGFYSFEALNENLKDILIAYMYGHAAQIFKLNTKLTNTFNLKALFNIVQTWFKKSEGGDVSCLLVALDVSKNSWEYKNSDRKTQRKQ